MNCYRKYPQLEKAQEQDLKYCKSVQNQTYIHLEGKKLREKKYGYFTYSYICKIKYVLTQGPSQGSNQRSANCNLWIEFIFSQITLSSFCEICESKLSFCWKFCLQRNHKVSVYIAYILLHKVLNCAPFSCIWIAIWPPNPQWEGLLGSPIASNCWNFSLNLCESLLKR